MEKMIQKDISQVKDLAITHDTWTSMATQSFFTLTAHYITVNWELKTVVLETTRMEGSHTSDHIAETLMQCKKKWVFPQPTAVTDDAANEKKAFSILKWLRLGCFGHRISNTVKKGMSDKQVDRILGKARNCVTFFHCSTSMTDLLMTKQSMLLRGQAIGHILINDIATRWNYKYYMLKRLCEQTPAISAVAMDDTIPKVAKTKLRNFVFDTAEYSIVEKLVEILEPFEMATKSVTAEKCPTLHKVVPTIVKLLKAVEVKEDDPEVVKLVKTLMSTDLTTRTSATDERNTALLASLLDPSSKKLLFVPLEEILNIHTLLKKEIQSLVETPVTVKKEPDELQQLPPDAELPQLPADPELPAPKKARKDDDMWLQDVICVGTSKIPSINIAEQELSRYLSAVPGEGDEELTLLEWWKKYEPFYPNMARLAKKYLAIPASSVPSERVFSVAGTIVNKKRNRLSPKNIDLFIFLNKNMNEYWL
jgi:hypothetical protein